MSEAEKAEVKAKMALLTDAIGFAVETAQRLHWDYHDWYMAELELRTLGEQLQASLKAVERLTERMLAAIRWEEEEESKPVMNRLPMVTGEGGLR